MGVCKVQVIITVYVDLCDIFRHIYHKRVFEYVYISVRNIKKHKAGVLKEKVINTVGSGDSMVAGFVAGFIKTGDYAYALKLGSVCGNATAFLSGLATKEKINELMAKFDRTN